MALSRDDRPDDLIQARSDLLDILGHDPENTGAIVTIIENELKDIKDKDVVVKITNALNEAASRANVGDETRDNVLY